MSSFTAFCGPKISWRNAKEQMLIEIFALHGMSKVDRRYTQISGSILDIPEVPKSSIAEIYNLAEQVGTRISQQTTPSKVVGKSQIGQLDIDWRERKHSGRVWIVSQLFPTEHCQATTHLSNRKEIRFTLHKNGAIEGHCWNCGESWWEKSPPVRPAFAALDRLRRRAANA